MEMTSSDPLRAGNNLLVVQAGSASCAGNAALSGLIAGALDHEEIGEIYGALGGLRGLLAERFIDLEAVKEDKNHWIIKPEDGYAAKGVHAGRDYTTDSWATLIDELANTNYIAQNYAAQQPVPNTRLTPIGLDPAQLEPWNLLTGLYLYNGRLSGLYVRAGQSGLIAGFAGGITVPTLLAGYDSFSGLALRTRDFS